MKMLRILIFGLVALAQLAVPATMVWQRDQTLKQGRIWKFRTAPVDPVDVIRGRYIALRFTAEEFAAPAKFEAGNKPVYAVLKQSTDGFAEIDISQPKRREPTMPFRLNQSGGGEANSRCVSRSTNSGLPKQTQPQRNAHTWRTIAATIRMPTSQFACAVGTQPSISSTSITSRYLSISARIRRNEQNRFAPLAIFCSHRPVAGRPT